ncbi:hypothetical protein, variant [Magnaporthiopsis poae ATCC 64411]|uniref:Uncharacterized protein n=1 Tax=Magnaporthiopsis poae (strain ATCC 64411 / 73-15) TaxID=644358 RepID=A0A0C4DPR9_MAGP6|nr:hypothetical protein, variant [Magnaporthiopsis poae ATCC 64411]
MGVLRNDPAMCFPGIGSSNCRVTIYSQSRSEGQAWIQHPRHGQLEPGPGRDSRYAPRLGLHDMSIVPRHSVNAGSTVLAKELQRRQAFAL